MKKILGIDPGKDKTGAALCEESGKILRCEVLLMEHFLASLQKFLDHVPVTECVLGNGTTSASMQKTLLAAYPDLAIHIIAVSYTNRVIPLTVVGQRDFLGSLSNFGPQSGKATG